VGPIRYVQSMRLGVYADAVYRWDGRTATTDRELIRFVSGLRSRVDELVFFGRLHPEPGSDPYAVPQEGARFVPLPYYPSVFAVPRVLHSLPRSLKEFGAELDRLDAVWLFGPNPHSVAFARLARRRGKTVFLGVRQDYPDYVRSRLPSRAWLWAVAAAAGLEAAYRRLSREAPTVVQGASLEQTYRAAGADVLNIGFSLIRPGEVRPLDEALARSWDGDLELLTVGRLDQEKNPMLLLQVLAGLRARDSRWRLKIVGEGPLRGAVEARIRALGLEDAVELLGYVPNGEALWARYRASNAFLHVSLTEGQPQVLVEAQAAGLPIVATDVGGVAAGVGGGSRGLLVPPQDARAAIEALDRIRAEEELRGRLIRASLEHAAEETMDSHLERVADFFDAHLPGRR
jgi:glycosyltransferase involved in cell wall biosynthesis